MDRTPAQHQAISIHDRNLIVVAGAGSGKTRVLVERFIALLEEHPDWPLNALVAITFTKKAAGEMRDRVRREIEKRAQQALKEGESAANALWSGRLQTMDSARIGTIHSLCETILRANAAAAGIAPDFEVLDEMDAQLLLGEVIDAVFQKIGEEDANPLAKLFALYDDFTIRELFLRDGLIGADWPDSPPDLMSFWEGLWQQGLELALQRLAADADFALAMQWQPPSGHFPASGDKLGEMWAQVHALSFASDIPPHDRYQNLKKLAAIKLTGGSQKKWGDEETLKEAKRILDYIRDTAKQCLEQIGEPPGALDASIAEVLPLWAELIFVVRAAYQAEKMRRGFLDFNDLEQRTRHLLEHSPEVRARYQNREFKHLLVDEFQDTNQAQWAIIRSLADLAIGGTLFVVGDPKQSIYQFRGADVSVFGEVAATIIAQGGQKIDLSRSFRTHQALIAAFNTIFARVLSVDEASPVRQFEVDYSPMSAHRQENPVAAPLEFILLNKVRGDGRLSSDDVRQWEAWVLGQRIQALVDSQMLIYDKLSQSLRPIRYDDVAILFQSLSEVTVYEDVFKQLGVPYITIAGRGYYARQEIWDLLNLLKALHNPADELSLAVALRSPLFNFSDDVLYAIRTQERDENGKPSLLWGALMEGQADSWDGIDAEDKRAFATAQRILRELALLAGRVEISQLLRHILDKTGYLAVLTALSDGARRRGNVEKLVNIAEMSGKVTLGAFTRYLDELSAREVREGEVLLEASGNVTLMSIHASKGLEFPVVIIASAHWQRNEKYATVLADPIIGLSCKAPSALSAPASASNKNDKPYAYQRALQLKEMRERAERKRLLYVAATRAQDLLIVSGSVEPPKEGDIWKVTGFLEDLLTALDLTAATEGLYEYDWGKVRVSFPEYDSEAMNAAGDEAPIPAYWPPMDSEDAMPPLMRPLYVARDALARHLAATQIADLGAAYSADAPERVFFRQRFRRKVLHDAPHYIESVVTNRAPRVSRRKIGEIVHDALRYWRFPDNTPELKMMLRSYAWQQGITQAEDLDDAVEQAYDLLLQFQVSDVYQWIQAARAAGLPFYTELPFIYRTDKRIIHGVMDCLFQDVSGVWRIVDYKSGYVPRNLDIGEHAARYHLQVGVYAAAVREQFGRQIVPEVYIHYIRYQQTVHVPQGVWGEALERLEDYLGDVIRDDEA